MTTTPSIVFGNLSISEIALVLAAVLLLFGGRNLGAINDSNPRRRDSARRDYMMALLGGFGFGIAISGLSSPSSITLAVVGALAIVAAVLLVLEQRSGRLAAPPMHWNPAVVAMGLVSCALTMDAMRWLTGGT